MNIENEDIQKSQDENNEVSNQNKKEQDSTSPKPENSNEINEIRENKTDEIENLDAEEILEVIETPDPEPDREYTRVSEEDKKESLDFAMFCADIADSMKAEDIKVIDVSENTTIADYFVIMTGFNRKQIQGIAFEIENAVKKQGRKVSGIEGYDASWWVLLDYNTVIINIFYEDARKYYELETLWADSKVVYPPKNTETEKIDGAEE